MEMTNKYMQGIYHHIIKKHVMIKSDSASLSLEHHAEQSG